MDRSAQPGLPFDLVHALVNEWDPIGVSDLVDDEYTCLEGPLVSMIVRGASRVDFAEYLWNELRDHFGLDPTGCQVDAFADRLAGLAAASRAQSEPPPHETRVITDPQRGRRPYPTRARWRCSCGAGSGERWYASVEEAFKAAARHTDAN